MGGPVPKRSEERRRTNKDGVEVEKVDLADLVAQDVEIPVAPEHWEPLTKTYWDSFQHSGQSIFYEPSDWMTAFTLMETLDRWLKPQEIRVGENRPSVTQGGEVTYTFEDKIVPIPGSILNAILKGLTSLMATEGDRRRLKIELERAKIKAAIDGEGSNVISIVKDRSELFK